MNSLFNPSQTKSSGRLRAARYLLVASFVLATIVCWTMGIDAETLSNSLQRIGLEPAGLSAQVVFFFVALVLVSLVLPKTVVSISAGVLFGTWTGGILIALISIVAAISNYWIGRWVISESIQHKLSVENPDAPLWATAIRDMATEAGYGLHLLLRFASIPSMLLNYAMGAVGAKLAPFMVAAVIGILPQLLWVHGASLASLDDQPIGTGQWISSLVSILAALAIAIIVPHQVMQRIKQIQSEQDQSE